jgi:hypothetical protein
MWVGNVVGELDGMRDASSRGGSISREPVGHRLRRIQ